MRANTLFRERLAVGLSAMFCTFVLLAVSPVPASEIAETYIQATIDGKGALRIVTKGGREIVPKKESDQVGFDDAQISPDGRSVGWLDMYPNCCTSYPIPLKLEIYSSGKHHTFVGIGLPVWRWCFEDGGKRVAFEQETVHGGIGVHYELHEVATGRLVAKYGPPVDAKDISLPTPKDAPKWVLELDAKH